MQKGQMAVKIFEYGTKDFSTNGLGQIMPDVCIEHKKKSLNGWYIECEVPLKYKDLIIQDNIAVVETKEKGLQPFLIESPEITNKISFSASHIVFSSQRYLLDDVRPTDLICFDFLDYLNKRVDTVSPFIMHSNVSERKTHYFERKNLLEALETTEELFNGIFDIDGYDISFNTTISEISDTKLIYGKNIEGMKIYENWDSVCTKIMPVGPDGLILPEKYLVADVQYPSPYTRTIKFSIEKENADGILKSESELINELRFMAQHYMDSNKYPKVNYTVTSSVEQSLKIGTIVPVLHPLASFETEVQSYDYDIMKKRVTSIEYGNYERSVKKAFGEITAKVEDVNRKTDDFLSQASREVDYLMNVAGKNGSIVFRKNDKGVIYEILCIDTNDINTAKTVMKLNAQGIAGGTNGVDGSFNTAMLLNGTMVADMIKTGTLRSIKVITDEGMIGGWSLNKNDLHATIHEDFVVYPEDKQKIIDHITGKNTLSAADQSRLDFFNRGYVSAADYNYVSNILNGRADSFVEGLVSINANRQKEIISMKPIAGEGHRSNIMPSNIGMHSMKSQYISAVSMVTRTLSSGNNDELSITSNNIINIIAKNMMLQAHTIKLDSLDGSIVFDKSPTISSDERLKENFDKIDLSEIFDLIDIVSFDYISGGKKQVGVIAQNFLDNILKDYVVSTQKLDDEYECYSVNYNVLFLSCIQKVKQLCKDFDDLKREVKNLK